MRDPRNARLAQVIVSHSLRLQPGEAVMIEAFDAADGLVPELVDEVQAARAIPIVVLRRNSIHRDLLRAGTEAQFRLQAELELFQMKQVQAYVGLRGAENSS